MAFLFGISPHPTLRHPLPSHRPSLSMTLDSRPKGCVPMGGDRKRRGRGRRTEARSSAFDVFSISSSSLTTFVRSFEERGRPEGRRSGGGGEGGRGKRSDEEMEEDQSEPRTHQRWCSRPTFPPRKSLQAFFFTARSARLKEGRPMGQAFMMEPRFAKCRRPVSAIVA